MKKTRFLSLFLALSLTFTLLTSSVAAFQSDIVDSMSVEAKAALLIDPNTDFILYEKNAYDRVEPASITKVMTALLVIEAIEAGELATDQIITADDTAWDHLDYTSSNQNIQPGERMSVLDLLYCLLVPSANEAANILAVATAGSIEAFVERMNERSAELGCLDSHYANAHGMPDENHYSTAYDIYLVAKAAMQYPLFRNIVSTAEYYVEPTNLTDTQRHFYNTNALLSNMRYSGYYYENCIGIKTGSTDEAGYCLLSAAEKEGQTLICVMMGCENPTDESGNVHRLQFSESSRLFEWGFENFSVHTILDATDPVAEVPVTMSTECDYVSVIVDGTLEAQLPNDVEGDAFEWRLDLPESVEAPVEEGQVLGSLHLFLDDTDYGSVDLVAVNDVSRSALLDLQENIIDIVTSRQFVLIVVLIIILIIVLIIFIRVRSHRRRSRYGRYRGRSNYRRRR